MAARNPNFTTQFQEFMKESFEKESSQRLAWFNKRRSQTVNRPRQLEVFRKKITEGSKPSEALLEKLPAIGKEARHARVKADWNDPLLENRPQAPLEIESEMRPPSGKTRDTLYDGFTKEGKGRYQYLRRRYDTIPEQKFEFPILSSWDYGWRLGDVIKKEDIKKPPFGRTRIVNDTFYNRNGIGISPPHPSAS
ncbi:protein SPMIP1-like [Littorina saxatilis]|uniref:Sperm microtubule inner protein 1 C-terminal domain-containing protein n=1 Tax=Littorina saxatilis TaxID=31220 RepID=A0AAN9GC16_9CAEN